MNKKITAIALSALMVLTVLSALVPAASAVEPVQVSAPYEFLSVVKDISNASLNTNFNLSSENNPSVLYYDFDEGEGAEILNFTVDNDEQKIIAETFNYTTSIYQKDGENWIAWMGEPYFVVESGGDWYLSKLLLDEDGDDTHLLRVGESLTLPNGYAITPLEIDVDGEEAWFSITKDGEEVDSGIVDDDEQFVYETDLNQSGNDDNWVLRFWVESVFAGMNTNLVKINGTQLLDIDVLKIDTPDDDTFTDFTIRNLGGQALKIERDSGEDIDLKEDGIVSFLGDRFNFRINEDGTQGALAVILTEPGIHELFVEVGDISNASLNTNFNLSSENDPSVLYYDFDEGEGAEILNFTVDNDEQKIIAETFNYTTSIYQKDGENWIAWMGEPYFVVESGGDWYLSKLLLDEDGDDTHLLRVGESLTLPNGYAITPLEIDTDGEEAWFSITKDGEEVDSGIVDNDEQFVYETDLNQSGDDDNWVLRFWVESVFAGMNTNLVKINGTQLLDTDVLKIDTPDDDTFTDFTIRNLGGQALKIERDSGEDIDLKEDGIVSFLGDRFNFRINEDGTQGAVVMVVQVGEVTPEEETPTVTPTETVVEEVTPTETVVEEVTPTEVVEETPVETEVPTPTPTKEPGFEAVFAIAGLLAVAYLVLRRRE